MRVPSDDAGPALGVPAWDGAGLPDAVPSDPPRDGERSDLVVVGGGLLGLTAALDAARAGLAVRLVEAGQIGEGASGLNGGQVIPGLKHDPEWLLERFGDRGQALVDFAGATADAVFDLIARERLDIPHLRNGWIQAAHTPAALAAAEERHRQWVGRGADAALLDSAAIERLTGARGYLGGWLDRRAGVVQPLALTRALARLAASDGVRIATATRAARIARRDGRWEVRTSSGTTLSAPAVLVAANAYADALVPGLARSIVWVHSFQIATAPLPPDVAATILPGGQAVSDSRRILVYYRKSPDGRLILGGRGRMAEPRTAASFAHLERAMVRLYPMLADVPIHRRWFGRVAMTPDHLPHLHEPAPGLFAVAGCQGRGVALMTALGPRIARYLRSRDLLELPFPVSPVRPIPFHRFRRVGIAAMIGWYRLRDAMEG